MTTSHLNSLVSGRYAFSVLQKSCASREVSSCRSLATAAVPYHQLMEYYVNAGFL